MEPPVPPLVFAFLLFFGMLILEEAGRRLGIRRLLKETDAEWGHLGSIESAVFALFGLLMAFTFSGAALRFIEKRMLITEEANHIETAYLRLQLLSHEARLEIQELFRRYINSRLETYRKLPNMSAARLEMAKSKKIQEEIWTQAVAATRLPDSDPAASWLVLPALNNMIDMATTRTMALQLHPPGIIYALLFGLGLMCSLLAGYRLAHGRRRSWLHIVGFVMITSIVVYVIQDIEYPRMGLIRLDVADELLVQVRDGMN